MEATDILAVQIKTITKSTARAELCDLVRKLAARVEEVEGELLILRTLRDHQ